MCVAAAPAHRLPSGMDPMKAIVYRAITRPRLSSSTSVCSSVFVPAIITIMPSPVSSMTAIESGSERECEKASSPREYAPMATAMTLPSPRTPLRDARKNAPIIAPTPTAAMSRPRVCGPPCRTRLAKTGMSIM